MRRLRPGSRTLCRVSRRLAQNRGSPSQAGAELVRRWWDPRRSDGSRTHDSERWALRSPAHQNIRTPNHMPLSRLLVAPIMIRSRGVNRHQSYAGRRQCACSPKTLAIIVAVSNIGDTKRGGRCHDEARKAATTKLHHRSRMGASARPGWRSGASHAFSLRGVSQPDRGGRHVVPE
jgi:hypothetical protein